MLASEVQNSNLSPTAAPPLREEAAIPSKPAGDPGLSTFPLTEEERAYNQFVFDSKLKAEAAMVHWVNYLGQKYKLHPSDYVTAEGIVCSANGTKAPTT